METLFECADKERQSHPELDLVRDMKVYTVSGLYQQQKKDRGKYGPFAEVAWSPVPKDVEDDDVLKASFASVLTANTCFQESQIPEISLQQ